MKFTEIEHKYLLSSDFNEAQFFSKLVGLGPTQVKMLDVRDRYYAFAGKNFIYRHRYDSEIQQLTVKSVQADAEVRTEVNIPIDQSDGDQSEAIGRFMESIGTVWICSIQKSIKVYYFDDCEVVFYRAVGQERVVNCIELEARKPASMSDGLRIIAQYEAKLAMDSNHREKRSLVELLYFDQMPPLVKMLFK